MKVNFSSNLNLYAKNQAERSKSVKGGFASGKTDVAEFTHGTSTLDKALSGTKASIMSDVYAPTSEARIAELKQAVKDGSYHVSTDDIVKALLGE